MWKLLVLLFRFPISIASLMFLLIIVAPLYVGFSFLLLVWVMLTLPFMLIGEIIKDNPEGIRSYLNESFNLPINILGGLGDAYRSWWNWSTGGTWDDGRPSVE